MKILLEEEAFFFVDVEFSDGFEFFENVVDDFGVVCDGVYGEFFSVLSGFFDDVQEFFGVWVAVDCGFWEEVFLLCCVLVVGQF